MKNFKLIHETPDHFVLHNGAAHFHVAKSGITGETAGKIRALAKGGEVGGAPRNTEDLPPPSWTKTSDNGGGSANYGDIKTGTAGMGDVKQAESGRGADYSENYNSSYAEGGKVEDRKPASADQQTPNPDAYQATPLPQDQKDAKPKKIQVNMDQGDFDSIPGFAQGGALTTEQRNRIPQKNFALPNGRYPIENESHARNALARVSGNGTPAEKATVRAKVHAKYPDIQMKADGGKIEHDPKNLTRLESSFDKFIGEEGKERQKFDDGGQVQPQPDATATPAPAPILPGADSAQTSIRNAFGYAQGGSIANETQSQAIKRYADGNPATLSKGGHVHTNAGKNTLHFHFYDGASVPSPLDQYEGNMPNPGPAPTALDNYADGGKVVQGDDTPITASRLESTYGPEDTAAQSDSAKLNNAAQDIQDATSDQNNMISGAAADQAASQTPGATPSSLPSPSATTANSGPVIPQEQQIPAAPKASPVTPDQQPNMLSDFDKNMALEQQGIQQGANAQSAGYKATAQAIGENQLQQKAQMDRYNIEADKLTAQNKQLFDGVASSKVDPQHFWNSKSTGGKIASVIGVLLGGIGGGINGTHQNQALQTMQRYQEQDIDAQKNDQSNKMNLYKMGLERYHDEQSAQRFAMLQSNALLQGTLQKIAAQTGMPQAQATAQQMIGQLGIQNAGIRSELALKTAAIGSMNAPQAQAGVDTNKLRLLTMAGVIPKDEAPAAQKEYGDYQQLSNALDHTDQVFKTATQNANYRERLAQSIPGGSHLPTFTDASKKYQAVTQDWLGNITKETEGRVTPTDVDLMRPSLPQPGDDPSVAAVKLNNIKDQIREKYKFPTLQTYKVLSPNDPVATSSATRAKKFSEGPPK